MSLQSTQSVKEVDSIPGDVAMCTPEANIRKTYSYQFEWPSELDVEKPAYRQSSQTVEITWPGIIAGSAIYGVCVFLVAFHFRMRTGFMGIYFGNNLSERIFTGSVFVAFHIAVTACALIALHFLMAVLGGFFAELISARRAVLLNGAIALIPASLAQAYWWNGVIGWVGFVIFVLAGIWIGAYSAAAGASRFGKFTYTDRKPSTSEQLQFRIPHLFGLMAITAIVAALARTLPEFRLLLSASSISLAFFLLILFDRKWMRFHGEF